ncbi:polyprotein of viral origin, putative, partial [Ixodes scapularis]
KWGMHYRWRYSPGPEILKSLPVVCRPTALRFAHNSTAAGHPGVKKTIARLEDRLVWPNLSRDVREDVRSCDVCQPHARICTADRAELHPAPVVGVPFEEVSIDIVGPIEPRSRKLNRVILVLTDNATRFPEAIPLRNADVTTVAQALFEIFARVDIPKVVRSDQGTNFTSAVVRDLWEKIGVKTQFTSVSPPRSPLAVA